MSAASTLVWAVACIVLGLIGYLGGRWHQRMLDEEREWTGADHD